LVQPLVVRELLDLGDDTFDGPLNRGGPLVATSHEVGPSTVSNTRRRGRRPTVLPRGTVAATYLHACQQLGPFDPHVDLETVVGTECSC
jgi:hypothetical protein